MAYINFWRVCFALTLSAIGFGAAAITYLLGLLFGVSAA